MRNKDLHTELIKICMTVWNVDCLAHCCCHCWNTPLTASLCSHPLFGLHNTEQLSVNVSECPVFPVEEFNSTLCFIRTSMSDATLSDCPSAAISFFNTKKRKQHNHRTSGICDLAFVEPLHQTVAAVLSEMSRCWPESMWRHSALSSEKTGKPSEAAK